MSSGGVVPPHPSPFSVPQFGIGSLACYANLDQVGEGTYGFVYKATDVRSGETVALKR